MFLVSVDLCSGVLRNSSRTSHTSLVLDFFRVPVDVKYRACDEDVEEVGVDDVEELVDKPGTTNGGAHSLINCNQFSCPFFGELWFSTAGPVVGIPMILAEFPERTNCGCFFLLPELYRHKLSPQPTIKMGEARGHSASAVVCHTSDTAHTPCERLGFVLIRHSAVDLRRVKYGCAKGLGL